MMTFHKICETIERPIPRTVGSWAMFEPLQAAEKFIEEYIKKNGVESVNKIKVGSIEFEEWRWNMKLAYEEARDTWSQAYENAVKHLSSKIS